MEGFLAKNPGLRSRIAFHVNFDDYNPRELYEILELISASHQMRLGNGVKDKVFPILESAAKKPGFGNGRFVRNLFERARLKQASRLVRMNAADVEKSHVTTLLSEDFEALKAPKREEKRIGFIA
jgi:hypothetical protein